MSNTAKASHKLATLIDRRSEIHNQTNDGRRRFVCDPEARSYPTFRTDGAADYYIDCAAAVPEFAAELSSDSVAVALHSILSCFTGSVCFDSTAVKASISRLKEAEKEQIEIANNSESQVEVMIGIGRLG